MNQSLEAEVKVGIFVTLGCGLILLTILLLGGARSIFSNSLKYKTKFNHVEGIVEGATVKVSGVRVGQVDKIQFQPSTAQIEITFSVQKKYQEAIREDSTVSMATQGVLGDKYIVISAGNPNSPIIPDGGELKAQAPKDLKDYLSNADQVLERMKSSLESLDGILGSFNRDSRAEIFFRNMASFSTNVKSATGNLPKSFGHLDSIFAKIDRGDGTLGALINDPTLYDDLKALLGGANRNKVLKYFVRKSVEDARENSDKAAEEARKAKKP